MTEDKDEREPDPRFLLKVALAGLALHLAGYLADCLAAGDAVAAVFFAGWLWRGRGAGKVSSPGSSTKGRPGPTAARHVMWRLLIGLAMFLAAALLGAMGAR